MSTYTPRHISSSYREPTQFTSPACTQTPLGHNAANDAAARRLKVLNSATGGEERKAQVQIIRPMAEHRNFPMSFIPQIIQFSRRPGRIAYYITIHLISKDTLTTPLGNNDTSVRRVCRWRPLSVRNVCTRPAEPFQHD